jgi:large subunit ribosomal protein L21
MYAIVEIAGQQFKVEKDQKVFVHRLQDEEGSEVVFDKVLLTDDKGNVSVGTPIVKGAQVKAKVLSHLKGDKVLVFKKKRRKGYKVKNGHRQYLTQIQVTDVAIKAAKPKATEAKAETAEKAVKAPAKPKAAAKPKATTAKAAAKPKTTAKPKATATKAAATKKETKA